MEGTQRGHRGDIERTRDMEGIWRSYGGTWMGHEGDMEGTQRGHSRDIERTQRGQRRYREDTEGT